MKPLTWQEVDMTKAPKSRLDDELLRRGLCETLETARALIMAGKVVVDEQRQDKPGIKISPTCHVRVKENSKYVSRAGEKLAGAISSFGIEQLFKDKRVLDAGASTGGFTQCALEFGAEEVIAVDVGTNQLAWELRNDKRITSVEKTNIFEYSPDPLKPIDIITADLSFTSLARIVVHLAKLAPQKGASFIVLVKPQFELGKHQVPPGGIIADDSLRREAVNKVRTAFEECGITNIQEQDSKLEGTKGNREIFLFATR